MPVECRTCSSKTSNNLVDIFSDDLPARIEAISSVEILPDYGFSNKICDECVRNVCLFHSFQDQILKSKEVMDSKINEIQNSSECRICLKVSENVSDLFCDALPNKIEIISGALEITQDDRFSSKICAECEKQVRFLYKFRTTIIENNITMWEHLTRKEADINIEEMKLEDATLQLNESRRDSGIMPPVQTKIRIVKKKIHMYKCLHCKFLTQYYMSWKKHNKSHNRSLEEASIVCEVCGKLINNSQLSAHLMTHSTKKVECTICGQLLKHEVTLKSHLRLHEKIEQFECSKCGKLYKSRHSYKIHLDSHEGKIHNNFKCSLCERRFCNKSKLGVHFRSHTGERPYPCKICNKGFSSSYALKTHTRQHTQEKPYKCRNCDAEFKQAVLLRRHTKVKHPEEVVEKK